ncbi:single-stranded DNA-binding protein [Arthrobacter sp. NPDC080073]|uniref:single-stranded DNA-binding protein n=1 Tax=Arthrobacter sp. NPDC080073 TaxID=3155919 RepID=UPI00344A1E20
MAKIEFTGNLGGEPAIDFKRSGNACLTFNVADTKGKKDGQGNWDKSQEQTQWFRCTLWGPDAEYYIERLRKGARVTVHGDFMSREYVDRDGVNWTSLDVTVRGLSVVNKKGSQQQPAQQAQHQDQGWGNPQSDQAASWGNEPAANHGGWG